MLDYLMLSTGFSCEPAYLEETYWMISASLHLIKLVTAYLLVIRLNAPHQRKQRKKFQIPIFSQPLREVVKLHTYRSEEIGCVVLSRG